MINIANVASASALLSTDLILTSNGVVAANASAKAEMETMIRGTWSLLFKESHKTYQLPSEVATYVAQEINKALTNHHSIPHGGTGSVPPPYSPTMCPLPVMNPMLAVTPITKMTRGVQTPMSGAIPLPGDSSPEIEIPVPSTIPVTVCALPDYAMANLLMV